ncbi:type III secretion protein [Pseudomonas sp. ADAK18]|uniref:type III secretion protein n=1 Tax=Pseudomonas sp. ADAK18 TaxID=2730848 RepID=UPI001463C976|nr:type III secretion protein [Pseudomonas sp. ADAK18]QJI27344.1 type III secretion protein [Pseudomonas sp. ADAK18]
MLTLIGSVCQAVRDNSLEENEYLWCQRLAKALPPDSLMLNIDDPLQYLRAWVEPAVWQRLRIGFANQRVLGLEKYSNLPDSHGRLNTLWQAVIWRATAMTNDGAWP